MSTDARATPTPSAPPPSPLAGRVLARLRESWPHARTIGDLHWSLAECPEPIGSGWPRLTTTMVIDAAGELIGLGLAEEAGVARWRATGPEAEA